MQRPISGRLPAPCTRSSCRCRATRRLLKPSSRALWQRLSKACGPLLPVGELPPVCRTTLLRLLRSSSSERNPTCRRQINPISKLRRREINRRGPPHQRLRLGRAAGGCVRSPLLLIPRPPRRRACPCRKSSSRCSAPAYR